MEKILLEIYERLDTRQRARFDRSYNRFKQKEKLELISKRKEIIEDLKSIVNDDGEPFFDSQWLSDTILGNK